MRAFLERVRVKLGIIKIAVLISGVVLVLIMIFSYLRFKPIYDNYNENLDNRMVRVYFAVQDIEQGGLIYANMISIKEIYAKDLEDDYVRNSDLLIGKCVKDDVSINTGDIIRSSLIEECK